MECFHNFLLKSHTPALVLHTLPWFPFISLQKCCRFKSKNGQSGTIICISLHGFALHLNFALRQTPICFFPLTHPWFLYSCHLFRSSFEVGYFSHKNAKLGACRHVKMKQKFYFYPPLYILITSIFCWHFYCRKKLIKFTAFTAAIKLCQLDHARREIIDISEGEKKLISQLFCLFWRLLNFVKVGV